jgi:glycosyltransferase involved in cell wall biosynthesis
LSPGIVDGIAKRGINRSQIIDIPNGCDLRIFANKDHPWRPEGIQQEDFMAVFAGTHGMANDLNALLDVAVELKKRGRIDIKFLLVGQGKLKPELLKRAENENLTNVIFHEPVNKSLLSSLMSGTDLGLQILANIPAFYYGTSPNKFFDYIAAGVPVLINYPGWLAELIKQFDCGLTVPPENAGAFADAREFAADNKLLLQKMGAKASVLAKTQFSRDDLADCWVDWVVNGVGKKYEAFN